ncbi:MAG: tail fiber domain-containing protein [Bacteroidales bacterium]|nr:tail fiber domain-containing protein [Bacteroidales bacterium]
MFALLMPALKAQGVPQAMKYQAVLHDIAGNTLANQTGISIRVHILEGSANGVISYSEIHNNVSTNTFGVINLEIGKGIPVHNVFSAIDWGVDDHYVRIEMEINGTGYTEMGVSQLLSVPYALYAGNAGNGSGISAFNLNDNNIPRYSTALGTLVNSGIYQYGDDSVKLNGVLTIQQSGNPSTAYTFPDKTGADRDILTINSTGHYAVWSSWVKDSISRHSDSIVLFRSFISTLGNAVGDLSNAAGHLSDSVGDLYNIVEDLSGAVGNLSDSVGDLYNTVKNLSGAVGNLSDSVGDLYNTVEDLSSAVGNLSDSVGNLYDTVGNLSDAVHIIEDVVFNYSGREQGEIAYWDTATERFVTTSRITYISDTVRINDYYMPLSVVGKRHNFVMVNETENGLEFKQPKTKGPVYFIGDTVFVDTSGLGRQEVLTYWEKGLNANQVSNKGLSRTNTGVGTNDPQAIFHTDSGHVFFKGVESREATPVPETPVTADGSGFLWNYHRSSLRVGGTDGTALWDNSTKLFSTGIGYNANPLYEYGLVLGNNSSAWGDWTFTLGSESRALSKQGFSIGHYNDVSSGEDISTANPSDDFLNLFAIGNANMIRPAHGNVSVLNNNFVLGTGNNLKLPEYSTGNFVIGNSNEIIFPTELLPADEYKSTNSIIIGNGFKQNLFFYLNTEYYKEDLTRSIAIGNGIVLGGEDNIAIGTHDKLLPVSRSIGARNITIGKNSVTTQSNDNISIGTNNHTEGNYRDDDNKPDLAPDHIHPGSITVGRNIISDMYSVSWNGVTGGSNHGGFHRGGNITVGQSDMEFGVSTNGLFNIVIGSGIEKSKMADGGFTAIMSAMDVAFETDNPNKTDDPFNNSGGGPNGLMTTSGTLGSVNIGSNNFVGREGLFSITLGSGNKVGDYGKKESTNANFYGHGISIGNGIIYHTGRKSPATKFMSELGGIIIGNRNDTVLNNASVPAVFIVAHGKVRKVGQWAMGDLLPADYASRRTGGNLLELNEAGELYIRGNLYTPSDRRLKRDIQKLKITQDPLKEIQAYSFVYENMQDIGRKSGFIAQEVQKYFPELVSVGSDGTLSMTYVGFVPVLWSYTQQLQAQAEGLQTQIAGQQQEIESLKEGIELLEKEIAEIKKSLEKKDE